MSTINYIIGYMLKRVDDGPNDILTISSYLNLTLALVYADAHVKLSLILLVWNAVKPIKNGFSFAFFRFVYIFDICVFDAMLLAQSKLETHSY